MFKKTSLARTVKFGLILIAEYGQIVPSLKYAFRYRVDEHELPDCFKKIFSDGFIGRWKAFLLDRANSIFYKSLFACRYPHRYTYGLDGFSVTR